MVIDPADDDVIRIRIDMASAIRDFISQLAAQAAEGETRAPLNPPNRAFFRELAPFRLVEYAYLVPWGDHIAGAYLGLADGSVFSVADDIPESVVDAVLARDPLEDAAPAYLYVLLDAPRPGTDLAAFADALARHLDRPLLWVWRDGQGAVLANWHDGEVHDTATYDGRILDSQTLRPILEADRYLNRDRVLDRHRRQTQGRDGVCWAQITYNFQRHVVEFSGPRDRDDFIRWSQRLCEWIYGSGASLDALGLHEVLRPADIAPVPQGEVVVLHLEPPSRHHGGQPWRAFGGTDADTSLDFAQSPAAHDQDLLHVALDCAGEYWRYITSTITMAEMRLRKLAENQAKRHP